MYPVRSKNIFAGVRKMDKFDILYVIAAFLFQTILIIHFALRKQHLTTAIRYGRFVYTLSIPAAALSLYLYLMTKPWSLWIAGLIYFTWAIFGYMVEYLIQIQWRNPPYWPIFLPYILLYLATVMFYWWPLANLWKPLWYVYALLFVISTWLNVTSHKTRSQPARENTS